MPCHWICERDWFEIGECVLWGLFIFLALRPLIVKHVFIFFLIILIFYTFLKVFRICFICFFFLLGNTSHFDMHSHVKKGINQKRSVFVFHDWALQKAYLFIFFCQGPQQCLQNVKRNMAHHFGGESTCLKHTNITVQYEFYTLPGLCLQCACDSEKNFIFWFIDASLACILVRLLSNAHPVSVRVVSRKKASQKAQSSRRTEK